MVVHLLEVELPSASSWVDFLFVIGDATAMKRFGRTFFLTLPGSKLHAGNMQLWINKLCEVIHR